MSELIINKKSDLYTIRDKDKITKLVLNCEVNVRLLKGFNNVRELIIDNSNTSFKKNLNETTINDLSFKNSIEKLTYIDIEMLGKKYNKKKKGYSKFDYYNLLLPNIKSLTFTFNNNISNIDITSSYLSDLEKLEELIIDFGYFEDDTVRLDSTVNVPKSLKNIIFKFYDKEYNIKFDYEVNDISYILFSRRDKKIYLRYNNDNIKTRVEIDLITDEIMKVNELTKLNYKVLDNNTLFIPAYITNISYISKDFINKIEHLSISIDLLKNGNFIKEIADNHYLELIKTIEIRRNNEMALFPNIIIDISKYGTIEDLYIEYNKLNIEFMDFILSVDELGNIGKVYKEPIENQEERPLEKENNNISLDNYTISELEEYLQYRKLLETYKNVKDKELNDAIKVIGDRITKKLTK